MKVSFRRHISVVFSVYLLGAIIFVMYCKLVQFTCYVINSTRIRVPICVNCVGGSSSCGTVLLLWDEVFIVPVPASVGCVSNLVAYLALGSF
jgi:hypothetical protein